jgi:hypothetical protein
MQIFKKSAKLIYRKSTKEGKGYVDVQTHPFGALPVLSRVERSFPYDLGNTISEKQATEQAEKWVEQKKYKLINSK